MGHVWLQLFRPSEFKHPEGFGKKIPHRQKNLNFLRDFFLQWELLGVF